MKKPIISACLLIVSAFGLNSFGQNQAVNQPKSTTVKSSPVQFFPLSELKEGMRGTARTVFRGSEPEEFQVEILGIVPGYIGPKQDMIVGRISGGSADRTSVFAGMSGSPVYIDGKLVGAISYSFPFSKEPICGITPISQMISIFERNQTPTPKSKEPKNVSFAALSATDWQSNFTANGNSISQSAAGQSFQPIATPIAFSGFSPETLNKFAPQLASAGLSGSFGGRRRGENYDSENVERKHSERRRVGFDVADSRRFFGRGGGNGDDARRRQNLRFRTSVFEFGNFRFADVRVERRRRRAERQ